MKGFAMRCIGETGWIEKDEPEYGVRDAIIKPLACSPCTSDIHTVFSGAIGERKDMILGHEAVGEIVKVGELVEDFKVGDRVIVPAITPDWGTTSSQRGHSQHSMGSGLSGWKFSNFKDGVFAELFHVNEADSNLALLPDEIPLETAVMVSDMMTTGFHGAELADIEFGDSVAVIGIGPVGLMAVAASALRGGGRIFGVGSRPNCISLAREYGATDIINYKNGDIVDQILNATSGKGVDKIIIAGGDSSVLPQAIKILKPGGVISNINYFGEGDLEIPRIEWGCGMAHKTIRGGLCPGGRHRMEQLVNLIVNKRVDPGKMVTHVLHGMDEMKNGLMLMYDKPKDLIKPVVLMD